MLTLSLCQKVCPELIPNNIGNVLGDGSDGQVFELTTDLNKVIKISALFVYLDDDLDASYFNIKKSLNYLISNYDVAYARVYEYIDLGKFSRQITNDRLSLFEQQDYILYYYVMEKCQKLSDDEKKVFHSILSHEDLGIKKNYSLINLNKILLGLSRGLDFDEKKVILFCDNLKRSPLKHLDLHPRNVMKDNLGNFKLVDFDHSRLELL